MQLPLCPPPPPFGSTTESYNNFFEIPVSSIYNYKDHSILTIGGIGGARGTWISTILGHYFILFQHVEWGAEFVKHTL